MIGKFREQIDIFNFSTESNGQGGLIPTLRIDETVWARIKPLSGSKNFDGSQINLEQSYEIWFRYEDYEVLSKKNWFRYQNRLMIIQAYQIVEEKRKFFKVIAKEDAGKDVIIYNENFKGITDENGNLIYTENA